MKAPLARLRIPNGRHHVAASTLRQALARGFLQGQMDANQLDRACHLQAIVLLAKGGVAGALAVLTER